MDKADEIILELLWHNCGEYKLGPHKHIDTCCIKANEEACNYLRSKGILTTKNGRIYYEIKT